jgi:chemotaxis protein MotA
MIGIVGVIGAIVGGHLMEHGNLKVLLQPAELVGTFLGILLCSGRNYTNWNCRRTG